MVLNQHINKQVMFEFEDDNDGFIWGVILPIKTDTGLNILEQNYSLSHQWYKNPDVSVLKHILLIAANVEVSTTPNTDKRVTETQVKHVVASPESRQLLHWPQFTQQSMGTR